MFAATSAEVAANRDRYKAQFLYPYGRRISMTPEAHNPEYARALWETTEKVAADVYSKGSALV